MTPRSLAASLALVFVLGCASAAAQEGSNGTADPSSGATGAATDQGACSQPGKNIQCTGFGSISADTQRDIKGAPITLDTAIWLNTNYADQGARWVLFSVRNVTGSSPEPIAISLLKFSTPNGEVVTTRVDHEKPNEIDLWVDVLDLPTNAPITLSVEVGSSDRGAYRLETLVLAFDRGYETVKVDGGEASLFASTLIGVNKESGQLANAGGGSSILEGKKMPGVAVPALLAVLAVAAAVARRRTA